MAAKKAPKAPAKKTTAIQEKYTKTAILNTISEDTGLTKKQVGEVLDSLGDIIERHLKKRDVSYGTGFWHDSGSSKPNRPCFDLRLS